MVSRRGYLLPAGCRSSFSRQPRSENSSGGGTERSSRKRVPPSRVSGRGVNIGEGGVGGPPRAARRVPGAAQGGAAPGTLLAPWWWPRSSLLVLSEASRTLIFNIIFPEFFGHFK